MFSFTPSSWHTKNEVQWMYEDLNNKGFIRIHIGCIVNAKHISTFETNRVILDCGKEFIISKKYKDIAKKNYYDWLVKEYA